jgi:tetratricopeptide (TPR) repeat protein
MGEALYRLGDFNQARTYLEQSLVLMGEGLPTSRWGTRLAIVREIFIQFGHRIFSGRFMPSKPKSASPRGEEIYLAVLALTWIEAVADFERWLLVSISALNATEREVYPYGSAYLASLLSSAVEAVGQHGLAERYYRLAEGYSKQVIPYRPVFQLAWNRSFHYNLHGDFDRSLEYAHNGLEIAHNTGDLRSWGTAMDLTAWAQHISSKFSKAVETRLEMISVAEEGSDPQVLCWGYFGLGATQIRLGQIDEAIGSLQRAIEIAEEVPDFHTQLGAGAWLGRCYLAKGELTQALLVVEDSQELFSVHGVVVDAPYLGNSKSEIYLMAAESTNGEARQRWLKKAKRSCRDTVKVARNNRPTLPDALLLQGRYEWLQGKPETAQKWWEKATKEAQRICDTYMEGTIQLEIGRRLGNRDHLQRAKSILEEISAEFELAKAKEALANVAGN